MTVAAQITQNLRVAIIGLGYVGLPLAYEFSKHREVVCFDIDEKRILELRGGYDRTLEIEPECLQTMPSRNFTCEINELEHCNCYIATVPTPIDENNKPDLTNLIAVSEMIGGILKDGDVVIFESTVYPGATEEICAPILAKASGLTYAPASDTKSGVFHLGYSPERINPGDRTKSVADILKITSGSDPHVATLIDELYSQIIKAGTYKASSIKVAEAAKVIENTQRDVNIALVNELAIIFDKMEIDTREVLEAASTKWNFLDFKPGLVGGHCIGVDPYYLTHKSELMGYSPTLILAGRKINDEMSDFVAKKVERLFEQKGIEQRTAKVLILGLTFKENCPDTRNSKVFDLVRLISQRVGGVDIFDPYVVEKPIQFEKNVLLVDEPKRGRYDCVIIAVGHTVFIEWGIQKIKSLGKDNSLIFDLKYCFKSHFIDGQT